MHIQSAFETYLYQDNKEGSGKASSYLTALKHLQTMLQKEPYEFFDCIDFWRAPTVERLVHLRERVKAEAKRGSDSPWYLPNASSYLVNGYCSAALTQLIDFLPQYQFANQTLDLLRKHKGEEADLADKLNRLNPEVSTAIVHDPNSKDGKERIRETKTRIGQHAFREVILEIYANPFLKQGRAAIGIAPAVSSAAGISGISPERRRVLKSEKLNGRWEMGDGRVGSFTKL